MESVPLTAEAIAFTEKKMDMTLGMLFIYCLMVLIHIPKLIQLMVNLSHGFFFYVYAEDIIKMSKKKNPGGKKAPRQPVSILIC